MEGKACGNRISRISFPPASSSAPRIIIQPQKRIDPFSPPHCTTPHTPEDYNGSSTTMIALAALLLHAPTFLFLSLVAHSTIPTANGLSAVAQARPDFYSELVSPLAQKALDYAEQGDPLPSFLDDDDNNNNNALPTGCVATFAGGCFWGIELAFQREPGVLATCVGYTQGPMIYPTYGQVCDEETGHTEAVLLVYDPHQVTYARLAEQFFDRIPDPTFLNRVGRDRGTQYRTGMYAHSDEQLVEAQTAFDRENNTWKTSGRPVVTEVNRATAFWPAEEVHQRYLEKGGRFGRPQSSDKGATDEIRCYG